MMIRDVARELFRRDPLLASVSVAHLLLFLLLIPAAVVDPRQILGISRWIKPMKFALSVALFTGTMCWLLAHLERNRILRRAIAIAIAVTMSVEMILIVTQAARGVRSHFNVATAFDGMVFSMMGGLIAINTIAIAIALVLFLRPHPHLGRGYLSAVRLGLFIFLIASGVGGMIISKGGHSVGAHDGSPGLPFVNWSTGAGDLRVAHFVGMHALQGLPLLGWLLDRRDARRSRLIIRVVAAAWLLITTLLLLQALAGRPLLAG